MTMLISLSVFVILSGTAAALLIARRLRRSPSEGVVCEVLEGVQFCGYCMVALGLVALYGLLSGQIRF